MLNWLPLLMLLAGAGITAYLFIKHGRIQTRPETDEAALDRSLAVEPDSGWRLLDKKITYYDSNLRKLSRTVTAICSLILLGLTVQYSQGSVFHIPILDIEIDKVWLSWIVPGALGFFWVHFGFLLNLLVGQRITLIGLSRRLADDAFRRNQQMFVKTVRTEYLYTVANELKDTGFLDAWMSEFQPAFFPSTNLSRIERKLIQLPLASLAVVAGSGHAIMLSLTVDALTAFFAGVHSLIVIVLATIWLAYLCLLVPVSHAAFCGPTKNPNWVSILMCLWAALLYSIMRWLQ